MSMVQKALLPKLTEDQIINEMLGDSMVMQEEQ